MEEEDVKKIAEIMRKGKFYQKNQDVILEFANYLEKQDKSRKQWGLEVWDTRIDYNDTLWYNKKKDRDNDFKKFRMAKRKVERVIGFNREQFLKDCGIEK